MTGVDQPRKPRVRDDQLSWIGVDPSQDEMPRPSLTRPRVVRTALRLVDEHGLATLTMRSLATELQVSPMALYNHVRDKEELLDLMLDLVLGEVDLSASARDWAMQMRALVCSYHQVLTAHPALARLYSSRVRIGPHGLRIMERGLGLLLQAGFCPADAADAFFALFTYTVGYHQMGRIEPQQFSALPPDQIPSVITVMDHLNGVHQTGRFEAGLDALLVGFQTLHRSSRRPKTLPSSSPEDIQQT
ncbi:MAG: TetR/AcrR family transcriptional regulator [Actinomycetota bacterium]|nr:TetR/AcrR family transcriptional regulator [Actinomycetota bacterium]